jgi:targeting protein for Xklp2
VGAMSQDPTAYSFNAPTSFINFSSLDDEEDTENIDSCFNEKTNLINNLGTTFFGRVE